MKVLDIIQEAPAAPAPTAAQVDAIIKQWLDKASPETLEKLAEAKRSKWATDRITFLNRIGKGAVWLNWYSQLWCIDQMAAQKDPGTGQHVYTTAYLQQMREVIYGQLVMSLGLTAATRSILTKGILAGIVDTLLIKFGKVDSAKIAVVKAGLVTAVTIFLQTEYGKQWLLDGVIMPWLTKTSGFLLASAVDAVWNRIKDSLPDDIKNALPTGELEKRKQQDGEVATISDTEAAKRQQDKEAANKASWAKLAKQHPEWQNPNVQAPFAVGNRF